jgi:hypothetical protein
VAGVEFFRVGFDARYFVLIFFRMRRSSMKQSPEVVQRTQPIMINTFMSIGAGSCPACALQLFQNYTSTGSTLSKDTAKNPPPLLLF